MERKPVTRVGTFIRVLAILALFFVISIQAYAPRAIEVPWFVWVLIGSFFLGAEGGEDFSAIVVPIIKAWRGKNGGNGDK